MTTVTVTMEIESYDEDDEAELDNARMMRNTLLSVADAMTEFYPGNVALRSDVA